MASRGKTLVLFRSAETNWSQRNLLQGYQAVLLADKLRPFQIKKIVTSPLQRAEETAIIVRSYLKVPLSIEPDFTEADCDDYETCEINDALRRMLDDWESPTAPDYRLCTFCEINQDIYWRTIRALERVVKIPEDVIGISTHSGIIRRLSNWLGGPKREIANGDFARIRYDHETKQFTML